VTRRIIEEMVELRAQGLVTRAAGNVSVRKPLAVAENYTQTKFWITPAGMFKHLLKPVDIVEVTLDGTVMVPVVTTRFGVASLGTPSSEWRMHAAIYRKYQRVKAIVHTHPPYVNIMTAMKLGLEPVSAEAAWIGLVPMVAYQRAGTPQLADSVAEALRQRYCGVIGPAVFIQNHGLVVVAETLDEAVLITQAIETAATLIVMANLSGFKPTVLVHDEVRDLWNHERMIA